MAEHQGQGYKAKATKRLQRDKRHEPEDFNKAQTEFSSEFSLAQKDQHNFKEFFK